MGLSWGRLSNFMARDDGLGVPPCARMLLRGVCEQRWVEPSLGAIIETDGPPRIPRHGLLGMKQQQKK